MKLLNILLSKCYIYEKKIQNKCCSIEYNHQNSCDEPWWKNWTELNLATMLWSYWIFFINIIKN